MDLTIDVIKEDEFTILSIQGEMDDFHAPKLNDTFKQVIDVDSCTKLIIDLEGTTFIDSVGLGTIAIAGKKLKSNQGHMGLVCTQSQILRLLNASGIIDALKDELSVHQTVEEAKSTI